MKVTEIKEYNHCVNKQNFCAQKREFIDFIADAVKNPRDVNDCVAVPRGIFKAYICIMGGSALLALSALAPKKWKYISKMLAVLGTTLNFISAVYFAKPFAFKGLSPTVDRDAIHNPQN